MFCQIFPGCSHSPNNLSHQTRKSSTEKLDPWRLYLIICQPWYTAALSLPKTLYANQPPFLWLPSFFLDLKCARGLFTISIWGNGKYLPTTEHSLLSLLLISISCLVALLAFRTKERGSCHLRLRGDRINIYVYALFVTDKFSLCDSDEISSKPIYGRSTWGFLATLKTSHCCRCHVGDHLTWASFYCRGETEFRHNRIRNSEFKPIANLEEFTHCAVPTVPDFRTWVWAEKKVEEDDHTWLYYYYVYTHTKGDAAATSKGGPTDFYSGPCQPDVRYHHVRKLLNTGNHLEEEEARSDRRLQTH